MSVVLPCFVEFLDVDVFIELLLGQLGLVDTSCGDVKSDLCMPVEQDGGRAEDVVAGGADERTVAGLVEKLLACKQSRFNGLDPLLLEFFERAISATSCNGEPLASNAPNR